jgi:hypothetical protein
MPDPTLDRAAAILRSGGRIAMTTAELAAALADPVALADATALADAATLGDATALADATALGDAAVLRHAAGTVAVLERRLADDDRFIIFDAGAELPGLEAWDAEDRLAYAAALRQVDLPRPPLVLLRDDRDPPSQPGWPASLDDHGAPSATATSLSRLLRHTVIALVDTRSGPLMAMAAEEACAALSRLRLPASGAAPSTIPPPGPPPTA